MSCRKRKKIFLCSKTSGPILVPLRLPIIMLGEAFLHILNYTQEAPEHTSLRDQNTHSHTMSSPETTMTHQNSKSPLTPQALRGREKPGSHLTSAPGIALTIPSCSVKDHWSMVFYSSGSCPSVCKAYPDLQLAGDTLMGPHHPHNPAHLIQSQSPFLQSQDLGSMEALETEHTVNSKSKPDEGYLVIESMPGPDSEPRLTNSMLNGFLETQLMEVYRQHMQDSLARCASSSLTASVVPTLVPANLSTSDDHTADLDNKLNSSSSQDSVQYLSTCSAPPTSHFSSPVLRISYTQEPNSLQ